MNTMTVVGGPVDAQGNERQAINDTQFNVSPAESQAYVESIVAEAQAMTPAERYALDAELTELVNAKGRAVIRGPRFEVGPGVFVGKTDVGRARARVRRLIQDDNGGSYDVAARFPGQL